MKKYIIGGIVGLLAVVGIFKLFSSSGGGTVAPAQTADSQQAAQVSANVGGSDFKATAGPASTTAPTTQPATTPTPSSTADAQLMKSTGQLFTSSQDYSYAYRIFPTFVSDQAKQAIDGFDMKTENLGNNLFRITLTAKNSSYKSQILTVSGDQKIYFIETSWGDDEPTADYALHDDYAVAVDSQGYILQ